MHTVIIQPTQDNPGTSPEGPLKVLRSVTNMELQETLRGPIQKIMFYDFLIKLYFRSNNPFITYLFLRFIRKTNIQLF